MSYVTRVFVYFGSSTIWFEIKKLISFNNIHHAAIWMENSTGNTKKTIENYFEKIFVVGFCLKDFIDFTIANRQTITIVLNCNQLNVINGNIVCSWKKQSRCIYWLIVTVQCSSELQFKFVIRSLHLLFVYTTSNISSQSSQNDVILWWIKYLWNVHSSIIHTVTKIY